MLVEARHDVPVAGSLGARPGQYHEINGWQLGSMRAKAFPNQPSQAVAAHGETRLFFGDRKAESRHGSRVAMEKDREAGICGALTVLKHEGKFRSAQQAQCPGKCLPACLAGPCRRIVVRARRSAVRR